MDPVNDGLYISNGVRIPLQEMELMATRGTGPGGQNINKVSTAIHLRFDIRASSLPHEIRERLLAKGDRRISRDGVLVIKAHRYRSRERNIEDARDRLRILVEMAITGPKPRRPTGPTRGSRRRRLADKTARGRIKILRGRIKGSED